MTSEEEEKFFARLLSEGIKPHADVIARAHGGGLVAEVFYDLAPSMHDTARKHMGWTGAKSEARVMTRTRAERLADSIFKTHPGDPAVPWLRGKRPGRILVWTGMGSLCIEHEPGRGFRLAPGTIGSAGESEWKN